MEQKKENVRELALDMLVEITAGRAYSHVLLRQVLDKYDYIGAQEKAFLKRLTEGTLERMIELDYVIDTVSSVPVKKQKPLIRCLLRLSVYQLLFMDSVPDSAACNEAVKLAQKRGFEQLKGFVNGVLRGVVREKDKIKYPGREEDLTAYLSVRYSMPAWIVDMWRQDYGDAVSERILTGLLEEHPVTVRLRENLSETEKKEVTERLAQSGVEVTRHPLLPYAFQLRNTQGMARLADFENGRLYVQDVSSMFVAQVLDLQGGERILDLCAAPGGKTLHAADKLLTLGRGGSVEARDVSEEKIELIEENICRLGLQELVHTRVADAAVQDETMIGTADVVIADVPCSGLGIIGKKPDIKYNMTQEAIEELVFIQKEILSVAQSYLKKGGILLFSTCTINRRENEHRVEWLQKEFSLEPVSLDGTLPKALRSKDTKKGMLQLLPGEHDTDGFFIAKLRKTT